MVIVIINPASGTGRGSIEARGRARAGIASRAFLELGVPHRIEITERPGHGAELARQAIAEGATLVCGWGGDGTVNEIASVLADASLSTSSASSSSASTAPTPSLGVIPGGSGNGLARELGISMMPPRAIQQAVMGTDRWLDVGEIGGRLFFNVAGLGFDAHVARCFNESRRRRGFLAYVTTSLTQLFRYRPDAYALTLPKETITGEALMVVLANSAQYGNGARVAPDARPDDGRLDLVVVEPRSPIQNVLRARRLFDGQLAREKGVSFRRVQTMTISNGHAPLWFHVDGEPVQGSSGVLEVRVHPRALRVRVPRP